MWRRFPSPIGELHFSIRRIILWQHYQLFPSPIGELHFSICCVWWYDWAEWTVSVPYRGATFLNDLTKIPDDIEKVFPSPIGELHFSIISLSSMNIIKFVSVPYRGATFLNNTVFCMIFPITKRFRPLSGSYISQYHPRNPMSCLGRIGGLRGKSNFIEIQPFWKVKSSHKSSI